MFCAFCRWGNFIFKHETERHATIGTCYNLDVIHKLQIRLPDGRTLRKKYAASTALSQVWNDVTEDMNPRLLNQYYFIQVYVSLNYLPLVCWAIKIIGRLFFLCME